MIIMAQTSEIKHHMNYAKILLTVVHWMIHICLLSKRTDGNIPVSYTHLSDMFSEGGCGNGDIHNMIELFELIAPLLIKKQINENLIWYEYGLITVSYTHLFIILVSSVSLFISSCSISFSVMVPIL